MSATAKRYHFATPAQWQAGLLARADDAVKEALVPIAPWGDATMLAPTPGVATAVSREGVACWNDGGSTLFSIEPDEAKPTQFVAGPGLAAAAHLVAGPTQLWAAGAAPRLTTYLPRSLTQRRSVDLPVARIVDIAADGRDGVWVLAAVDAHAILLQVDCAGQIVRRIAVPPKLGVPAGLTFLWRKQTVVLLGGCLSALHWLDLRHPAEFVTVSLRALHPCPRAQSIASDGRRRVVVAGLDDAAYGGGAWIVTLDAAGDLLGSFDLPAAPVDVACGPDVLCVLTAQDVRRYRPDATGAAARYESNLWFVTPALQSPPTDGRAPWLRAEVQACLPTGSSLTISHASTGDAQMVARVGELLASPAAPEERRRQLRDLLSWSAPLNFKAADGAADDAVTPCAEPLHDEASRWVWVEVAVTAPPGAAQPRVLALDVLYPDESILQYLPAVYRRTATAPRSFLHCLVATLDVTVADVDRRIEGLGGLLDAATAPVAWLNAVARWLALPWDDALDQDRKRALVAAAPALLAQRGTRAGLLALLGCLLPAGSFRVTDLSVDAGFIRLSCGTRGSARLPALLAGLPRKALALGRSACLGRGRLPCAGEVREPAAWLAGTVEVAVSAAPALRREIAPWLRRLILAMLPLGTRLRLVWGSPASAADVLTDDLLIEPAAPAVLGDGAALGRARLSPRGSVALDAAGADPGVQLQ